MESLLNVAVVGFDHMHAGDQLKTALDHSDVRVVGAYDVIPERAESVLADYDVDVPVFTDLGELIASSALDIAFVCTTTDRHAEVVEELAAAGVHAILEKPFAGTLHDVDRIITASEENGTLACVNWPLAWVPAHRTTRRLIQEGSIGDVVQVHFYDGNRGPLFHTHGKAERHPTVEDKASSWWYSRENGGGSLRDYLGYGVTLGTWFRDGVLPRGVTTTTFVPDGLEVDEQAVVVADYDSGLSVFETRWGTHSDPWTIQPSPRCGFVVTGTTGSITSWDYEPHVTIHRGNDVEPVHVPSDTSVPEDSTALANLIGHLRYGRALDEPMSSKTSRLGQLIFEASLRSDQLKRRVELHEIDETR